jgi:hypothetical protein
MNAAGLMNFFSHTRAKGAFISTIRQILYSFVRILNTRLAIGHLLQPTAVHAKICEVGRRKDKMRHRQGRVWTIDNRKSAIQKSMLRQKQVRPLTDELCDPLHRGEQSILSSDLC